MQLRIIGSIGWLHVWRLSSARYAFALIFQSYICVGMHQYVGVSATMHHGNLTYGDFHITFDRKNFPRETLHQKKNSFKHLRHDGNSVRQCEQEFS